MNKSHAPVVIKKASPAWCLVLGGLLCFQSFIAGAQKSMSMFRKELNQLHNIGQLPVYRPKSKVNLISTYDTTGGNDDGFSGKYSFVRKEGDYLVLADLKGPGAVHRIHTPTPTDKMLAFYFDGECKPRLRIPFIELFSGKHFPFIKPLVGNDVGGYYCYVPLPYRRSLKIVYEGKDIRFHQIQYRSYPDDSAVETFDTSLSSDEKAELQRVAKQWNNVGIRPWEDPEVKSGGVVDIVSVVEKRFSVQPGGIAELFNEKQGGRILGIEIDRDFVQWGRAVLLEAFWDNEETPSILSPADDFFGYSFGKVAAQGMLFGSFSGKDYCYLPMPWDKQAVLRLRALKSQTRAVTGTVRVFYTTQKRHSSREGKFYSVWRRETEPENGKPYLISDLKGRGHHVGTVLQAQGLVSGTTVFFEGDDVVSIDGERDLHGGGSEDYFNGGWYWILDRWDRGISLPIHGSLDYSLAYARTGGYRFFLSDKISFEKSFHFTIEHGPEGNSSPVDYTSLAFYYGDTPPETIMDPATKQDPVKAPIGREFYPRDFTMTTGPGTTTHFKGYGQYMEISGVIPTRGFVVDDAERGEAKGQVRFDLGQLESGKYNIYITYEEHPEGGQFSVWRRQQEISGWIDTYSDTAREKKEVHIGVVELTDQVKTITVRTVGEKERIKFFLKRLIFKEIQ